jgi:hypothetical protein
MVVSWLWSLGVRKNQEGTWKILLQSMFGMLDHALALEALHYSIDTSNQDTHQKAGTGGMFCLPVRLHWSIRRYPVPCYICLRAYPGPLISDASLISGACCGLLAYIVRLSVVNHTRLDVRSYQITMCASSHCKLGNLVNSTALCI